MPPSLLLGGGRKAAEPRGSNPMTGRLFQPVVFFPPNFPQHAAQKRGSRQADHG
jgi:hypothetical protein